MSISEFHQLNNNISQTQPSNPAGTTSLTGVMGGLAISFTPKYTGKIKVYVQAGINNNTVSDGANFGVNYGTGTAPNNGDAVTGTQIGRKSTSQITSGTMGPVSGTIVGFATGLTLGTVYWFDIVQTALAGGTAIINGINYIIEEIQN